MKTWDSDIYHCNHLRLMTCHLVLVGLNLALGITGALLLEAAALLLVTLLPLLLHGLLAYGSYRKLELSRKASVVVFVLLALGTIPIGTLVVLFVLLPTTQWQTPAD